ncbi:hypothetical protein BKA67DRAFT_664279 [Truncatella angustata]|uniref:Uncharacterized protein n=1 Tax=Truncatella angustata TaxID=152316 RepID=A0A9P8RN16_9PEZI|nr:uncharacterized protein BKA67DRAFT_664279 [Truncatella angustata]KAH6646440.1 hypothetical protein BKA67DRAFT_664279 [Truncatella angustata]
MLNFARSKKPECSKSLGPEETDKTSPQTPVIFQVFSPPVQRNFSYPINVSAGTNSSSCPNTSDIGQSICDLSPDNISKAIAADPDDPFLYIAEPVECIRSVKKDDRPRTSSRIFGRFNFQVPFKEEHKSHNKQRRSTILGLSIPQAQNTPLVDSAPHTLQLKETKVSKGQSSGDLLLSRKIIAVGRLKRNSLGQHKVVKSIDVSNPSESHIEKLLRPASSSEDTSIDTRISELVLIKDESLLTITDKECISITIDALDNSLSEETQKILPKPRMDYMHRRDSPQNTATVGGRQGDANTGSGGCKEKERRGGWFSHIKEWVSTSEPSTKALKDYKRDAFKRAGTTPNDPLATVKLHISPISLPPEAIKPCGRGLDPEEIVRRKAEQKRKQRQSFQTTASSSGGSRTSASQHSSLNSLALRELKSDA